ncbi:cytotoxic translational repressor of toxin-antitoxin stability system [Sciscionella sediminilitoris]|uniref:cytotoxic translational repressor of toxin-antitoxin stability system n=1 Tax=Sciscionella sediminilitoris TaxID=1445613 RepID=UPI000AD5B380|nr:cytotoxic translational repressor of toxin-antitoxin stability system [Sciscionella sp. SE31]
MTYEFALPDGSVLRTRISHPVDRTDYGPRLWRHILRDQLRVDEDCFWDCVRDGVLPDRGQPQRQRDSLPADLVHLLVHRAGVGEAEVAVMSRDEAIDRARQYWMGGG